MEPAAAWRGGAGSQRAWEGRTPPWRLTSEQTGRRGQRPGGRRNSSREGAGRVPEAAGVLPKAASDPARERAALPGERLKPREAHGSPASHCPHLLSRARSLGSGRGAVSHGERRETMQEARCCARGQAAGEGGPGPRGRRLLQVLAVTGAAGPVPLGLRAGPCSQASGLGH